jgi:hypothetical protein
MRRRFLRPYNPRNRIDASPDRADISAMIRRVLFVFAASCSFALAQSGIQNAPAEEASPSTAPKKLPNTLEKSPAAPAPDAPRREPDEIVATFFDALKADRVEAAYDTLKNEFAVAERSGAESKSMRDQTQKALDSYGPMTSHELVSEEKLGDRLVRRTYLLFGEVLPLRWKFYFYKPADRWSLIDLRIDDSIPVWFDEAAKK